MAACPDGGADKGTFTPFNSPVRQLAEEPVCSLVRPPLSTFYIIPVATAERSGRKASSERAKNYTPVAITIRPAAGTANRCGFLDSLPLFPFARNKGIVPPAVSLAPRIVAYVVFAPYDAIFLHLKLERARER